MRRAPLLLLALALPVAGCKLVDQRTFDRTADKPPVPKLPPAPKAAPSGALVSFPASSPVSDWSGVLRTAAELAHSRKANVVFRVQATVPQTGDPPQQARALSDALEAARQAADVIVDDGVPRAQVELGAATVAGIHAPEIRIFVR